MTDDTTKSGPITVSNAYAWRGIMRTPYRCSDDEELYGKDAAKIRRDRKAEDHFGIAAASEILARLRDHVENGPGIVGAICPSCGRDNRDYNDVCTSDDCMGVMDRAAIAKAEA